MEVRTAILAFALGLSLAACGADQDSSSQQSGAKPIGMANPAAVYCSEHGQYDLASGNCTLEDGSVIDAWAYFRSEHNLGDKPRIANPAAVYCSEHGDYDLTSGNCTLADGTVIDAWDYLKQKHLRNKMK